jgi:hypothetical protein
MKFGTPIAAIWTPKRAVAAAATLHHAGDIHFAVTGLLSEGDFDATAAITSALEEDGNFREKTAAVRENIAAPLTQAVQSIHDIQPAAFKEHLSSRNALDIFFIGKHDGATSLAHLSFATKKRGKDIVLKPQQADYPNARTDMMSIEIATAGMDSGADQFFRKGVTGQQALVRPLQTLQKFMSLAAAPFPVQTIKFTPAGVTQAVIESGDSEVQD